MIVTSLEKDYRSLAIYAQEVICDLLDNIPSGDYIEMVGSRISIFERKSGDQYKETFIRYLVRNHDRYTVETYGHQHTHEFNYSVDILDNDVLIMLAQKLERGEYVLLDKLKNDKI